MRDKNRRKETKTKGAKKPTEIESRNKVNLVDD